MPPSGDPPGAGLEPISAPRRKLGLWAGLGIGGVLGMLAGLGLAAILPWPFIQPDAGPVALGQPRESRNTDLGERVGPRAKHPPFPKEKFSPHQIVPTYPENLPPAMTVESDPGAAVVVKPEQARELYRSDTLRGVATLPDNRRCVVVQADGIGIVCNYRTGKVEREFQLPVARASSVAATADGKRLIVGCTSGNRGRFVLAWDLEQGRQLWRSPIWERALSFRLQVQSSSEKDRLLVFGIVPPPSAGTPPLAHLQILDFSTGRALWEMKGDPNNRIRSALWYPNGRQLLLVRTRLRPPGEDLTVQDLETRQEVPYLDTRRKRYSSTLYYWEVSPSGKRLVARLGFDLVLLKTTAASVLWRTTLKTNTLTGTAFSGDERWVACWGGRKDSRGGLVDPFVHVFDARHGREAYRLVDESPFQRAAFAPDGTGVIAVSNHRVAFYPLPERR